MSPKGRSTISENTPIRLSLVLTVLGLLVGGPVTVMYTGYKMSDVLKEQIIVNREKTGENTRMIEAQNKVIEKQGEEISSIKRRLESVPAAK